MKITKRQLRRIIREASYGVPDQLKLTAEREALRAFKETPLGRGAHDAYVTSTKRSPLQPETDYDVVYRVTIKVGPNKRLKRQWDIVLDAESGAFRGAGPVAQY
jgi:hypothetical protein